MANLSVRQAIAHNILILKHLFELFYRVSLTPLLHPTELPLSVSPAYLAALALDPLGIRRVSEPDELAA